MGLYGAMNKKNNNLELLREKTKISLILPNDLDSQFAQCEINFEMMKDLFHTKTQINKSGNFTEAQEIEIQNLILAINEFKFFQ